MVLIFLFLLIRELVTWVCPLCEIQPAGRLRHVHFSVCCHLTKSDQKGEKTAEENNCHTHQLLLEWRWGDRVGRSLAVRKVNIVTLIPKRNENARPRERSYTCAHSSTRHCSQRVQTPQMPIN